MNVPVVRTERLLLREWRASDFGPLAEILSDPDVTRYTLGEHLSDEDIRAAFERRSRIWTEEGLGFWAAEELATGELAGWIGLQEIHFEEGLVGETEVGWSLGKRWWGRGLATEGAVAALEFGFTHVGLERVYAFCHPDNTRSERVMQKSGMRSWGTTRDLRDGAESVVYEASADTWTAPERRSEAQPS